MERAAFQLKVGEFSTVLEVPEGFAILKCIGRIPLDPSKKLEDVRRVLEEEVLEKKIQREAPQLFQELREKAQPKLLIKPKG